MPSVGDFPGLKAYLSKDATDTEVEERKLGNTVMLRVTQLFSEGEGEQYLFSLEGGKINLIASDNSVEFSSGDLQTSRAVADYNGDMSDSEHAAVAAEAIASVDVFKTGGGPSKGARACLWAARRVVHKATSKWITASDGTRAFYDELRRGGMQPAPADSLPPGAIIISPTSGRKKVGHIGLLGEGSGGARLVYSNHSPSRRDPVARWEKNYTVAKFTEYHDRKGLPTYFFRLPNPAGALTS